MDAATAGRDELHLSPVDVTTVALSCISPYLTPICTAMEVLHPAHGRIGLIIEHASVPLNWSDALVAEKYRVPIDDVAARAIPQNLHWVRIPLAGKPSLAYDQYQAMVLLWSDHRKQLRAAPAAVSPALEAREGRACL
jgi:hypothetical protein